MRRINHVRFPKPLSESSEANLWSIQLDQKDVVISIEPISVVSAASEEDWAGDWLSPMGVDLQINGGLGLDFSELDFEEIPKLLNLLDRLWTDGIEAIAPTLISCDLLQLRKSLAVLDAARQQHKLQRCELLGAHLEGPFLSKKFHGAHDLNYLCEPSLSALEERICGFENVIALVTLAPELPGALDVIKQLRRYGIVVGLGHSSADDEASNIAFQQGVSMLTHTFNAMPGLHHRFPGPVGEAIRNGKISMGLIADGVHVHPHIAVLLQRLVPEKVFLVSDALSPYGLCNGKYKWSNRFLFVDQSACRLSDGTLAGTTLPLLDGCSRLARWSGEPSAAIWSATIAPRLVLGKVKDISAYLIGRPLKNLLRWKINSYTGELSWQQAD